jgi:hypothetical protein
LKEAACGLAADAVGYGESKELVLTRATPLFNAL